MRVGKRLGLGFGDASGFSEYFGLPALAVALDNTIVADNATVGTVVGEFNADGVTIVGASPFVIVGRELRVNSALTAGRYTILLYYGIATYSNTIIATADIDRLVDSPVASPTVAVKKIRGDYYEFAVYSSADLSGIDWARWYFCNRLNVGNTGYPRLIRSTVAKLFDAAKLPPPPYNAGVQAQPATVTVTTAQATSRVGTWTGDATISGLTNVRYSSTVGDYVEYEITGVNRLAFRCLSLSNGGIVDAYITSGGTEIASDKYVLTEKQVQQADQSQQIQVVPLAAGLDSGLTYVVRLTLSASTPASSRIYDGGILGFEPLAYNAVGVYGSLTYENFGTPGFASSSRKPGTVVVYNVNNSTRIQWHYIAHLQGGIVETRVYNSSGTLVTQTEIDTYINGAGGSTHTVADNLPIGNYYLHVELTNRKNPAASLLHRMFDQGASAVNATVPGVPAVNPWDDLSTQPANIDTAPATIQGDGNVELAVRLRRPIDNPAVPLVNDDFAGGIHGHESAVRNFVMKVDGVVADYAGLAVGGMLSGSVIEWECDTDLLFPADASVAVTVHWKARVDSAGYTKEFTRTLVEDCLIKEDYALMVQGPGSSIANMSYLSSGTNRVGDGYSFDSFNLTSNDDSTTVLNPGSNFALIYGDSAVIWSRLLNPDDVALAYVGLPSTQQDRVFAVDRIDGFRKIYIRSHGFASTGQLVPAGHSYTARQFVGVRTRLKITLSNAVIADNAPVGTVVGEFGIDGVTIVGSAPFEIVDRELLVDGALTEGDYVLTVEATGYARTTIILHIYTPSFALGVGENMVLAAGPNQILGVY